jgi:hypothetical protein
MLGYDQKVAAVRDKLRSLGARVRVRRRQLAHREKTYLHVVAANGSGGYTTIIMPVIRRHFPNAYMTSGSFDGRININIALEK